MVDVGNSFFHSFQPTILSASSMMQDLCQWVNTNICSHRVLVVAGSGFRLSVICSSSLDLWFLFLHLLLLHLTLTGGLPAAI
jgi:hypothetical protein